MLASAFLAFSIFSLVQANPSSNYNIKTKKSEPITFPITRNDDVRTPRAVLEADMRKLRHRFGSVDENTGNKRLKSVTIPLGNLREDVMYYSTIQMGTPPQNIDVQLDTASSDLWVYTTECPTCKPTSPLPQSDGTSQYFNKSISSTIHISDTPVSITYAGSDGVSGKVATETVSVGGFSVSNQTFIYVNSQTGTQGGPGIMGMGWAANTVTNATPWWLNAIDQFENPEFSFLLVQSNGTADAKPAPGGQFTLGGRNESVYTGEISFIPIQSNKFWDVPFTQITVSPSLNITITNSSVNVIDTGTTLIYGPGTEVAAFYGGIEGAVRGERVNNATLGGLWLIPCNTAINAEFVFGNVSVTLPAAALHMPATPYWMYESPPGGLNTTYCVGGIATPNFPSDPYWVFGDVFLKGVYTVFRKGAQGESPSIGFAKVKGVNYTGNGTLIIGYNGNGVDGAIGGTGPNGALIEGSSNSSSIGSSTGTAPTTPTAPTVSSVPSTSGASLRRRWPFQ